MDFGWTAFVALMLGFGFKMQFLLDSSNGFNLTQNIYAAKQTPVELAASTAAYFQRARWAL